LLNVDFFLSYFPNYFHFYPFKDLSGIVDKLALEDPADWEQVNQAGCAFWRKTVSGEIRVERPRMMGEKNSAVRTSATGGWQNEPEPYPLGTGLVFYDKYVFFLWFYSDVLCAMWKRNGKL